MNAKIYNGNVQPNPKEYKIWVNDEGIIKTWNGTEWIEQSGDNGESSGSGSGSGSGDDHVIYYKCDDGYVHINDFMNIFPFIVHLRSNGPSNRDDHQMYHPAIIANTAHGSLSESVYVYDFVFMPIKTYISGQGWLEYSSYEELREVYPELPAATRITEEEYWADYDAE